jgi:hypothetical protein
MESERIQKHWKPLEENMTYLSQMKETEKRETARVKTGDHIVKMPIFCGIYFLAVRVQ